MQYPLQEIKQFITKGKVDDALTLLNSLGKQDPDLNKIVIVMTQDYLRLKQRELTGVSSSQEINRERNDLNVRILQFLDFFHENGSVITEKVARFFRNAESDQLVAGGAVVLGFGAFAKLVMETVVGSGTSSKKANDAAAELVIRLLIAGLIILLGYTIWRLWKIWHEDIPHEEKVKLTKKTLMPYLILILLAIVFGIVSIIGQALNI